VHTMRIAVAIRVVRGEISILLFSQPAYAMPLVLSVYSITFICCGYFDVLHKNVRTYWRAKYQGDNLVTERL
jgi:hypothetical protein